MTGLLSTAAGCSRTAGAPLAPSEYPARPAAKLQQVIDEAREDIDAEGVEVPNDLRERLEKMIAGTATPWDEALWQVANKST